MALNEDLDVAFSCRTNLGIRKDAQRGLLLERVLNTNYSSAYTHQDRLSEP